jgi:hypothetical protein
MIYVCARCGTSFESDAPKRKFCSRSCTADRSGRITKHPLYKTWETIKVRTRKRSSYAGRGIKFDPRWQNDPVAFITEIEQEIGPRPTGLTLDRVDNDLGYIPGNLRWASPAQQQHNRSQRGTTHNGSNWMAQITREYKHMYIGSFLDEESAHQAYLSARQAYDRGGMVELQKIIDQYPKRG